MFEFGLLLRIYRKEWGLTQAEMAELLCISQPVYSRIEAGQRPISLKALQRVADRSGIAIHTLILAHLLLDKNIDAIKKDARDGASKMLLQLAEQYRRQFPAGYRDSAAIGLLYEAAPE